MVFILPATLTLTGSCFVAAVIIRWILLANPLYKAADILVLKKSFDGVIVMKKLSFGKGSVNLAVTYLMEIYQLLSLEGFRDEVMSLDIDST